jgi:hypothetical protein
MRSPPTRLAASPPPLADDLTRNTSPRRSIAHATVAGSLAIDLPRIPARPREISKLKQQSPDNVILTRDLACFDAQITKLEPTEAAKPGIMQRAQAAQ